MKTTRREDFVLPALSVAEEYAKHLQKPSISCILRMKWSAELYADAEMRRYLEDKRLFL